MGHRAKLLPTVIITVILLSGTVFAVPNAFATFDTPPDLTSAVAVPNGDVFLEWNVAVISGETFTAYTVVRHTSGGFDPLTTGVEVCNVTNQFVVGCASFIASDGTVEYFYELTYEGSATAKTAGGTEFSAFPDSTIPTITSALITGPLEFTIGWSEPTFDEGGCDVPYTGFRITGELADRAVTPSSVPISTSSNAEKLSHVIAFAASGGIDPIALSAEGVVDVNVPQDCTIVDAVGNPAATITPLALGAGQLIAPTVDDDPGSVTVDPGDPVTFTAAASGIPTPTVKWQKDTVDISPAETSLSLVFTSVVEGDEGDYRAVFTNSEGSVNTAAATLTVNDPPDITGQPATVDADVGDSPTFSVTATCENTCEFQWQEDGVGALTEGGKFTGTLTLELTVNTVVEADELTVSVVVTDDTHGLSTTSSTADLNVRPVVTTQPTAQTEDVGGTAVFGAVAGTCDGGCSFQWQSDAGGPFADLSDTGIFSGTGTATLTLTGVAEATEANFRAVLSDTDNDEQNTDEVALHVRPVIDTQPATEVIADVGDSPTFTGAATCDTSCAFAWQRDGGSPLTESAKFVNVATATLTVANLVEADEDNFFFIVTDGDGDTQTSTKGELSVRPVIDTQPVAVIADPGDSPTFTGAATCDTSCAFDWQSDGSGDLTESAKFVNVATATLMVANVVNADEDDFFFIVTDGDGDTQTSTDGDLDVRPEYTAETGDVADNSTPDDKSKIIVTFTEAVTCDSAAGDPSFCAAANWSISAQSLGVNTNGCEVVSITDPNGGTSATVMLDDGEGGDCELATGDIPSVNYLNTSPASDIKDVGNAQQNPMTQTTVVAVDGIPPEIEKIETGDGASAKNIIRVTMTEDVDSAAQDASRWTLSESENTNDCEVASISDPEGSSALISLTLDDGEGGPCVLDTGDKPDVTYTKNPDIVDASSLLNALEDDTVTAADKIPPELVTLSITTNNSIEAPSIWAMVGTTVTVDFTASEELTAAVVADVQIDSNDADSISNPTVFSFSGPRIMQTGDTEGVIPVSISFTDDDGNSAAADQGDVTTVADTAAFDETAPTGVPLANKVEIESPDDTADRFTFTRDVDLTLTCDDTNGEVSPVSGCDDVKVTGNIVGGGTFVDGSFSSVGSGSATLTGERGSKTVNAEYRDNAGNVATLVSDSIPLDAFFQNFEAGPSGSDATGIWESQVFTVSGEIVHPLITGGADRVLIDYDYQVDTDPTFDQQGGYSFPDPFEVVDITATGDPDVWTFTTTSSQYPRPSQDPSDPKDGSPAEHVHTPEATLGDSTSTEGTFNVVSETIAVGDDTEVDLLTSNNVVIQERATVVTLIPTSDPLPDVSEGNAFSARGTFEDQFGVLVPQKLIDFTGTGIGSPALFVATTQDGLIIQDTDSIVVGGDGIARMKPIAGGIDLIGAEIITAHLPGYVNFILDDMGDNTVVFEATDGIGNTWEVDGLASSLSPVGISVDDADGIAKVEVVRILGPPVDDDGDGFADEDGPDGIDNDLDGMIDEDGPGPLPDLSSTETAGIRQIITTGFELELVNDITFAAGSFTIQTNDVGLFFSEATAQDTEAVGLVVVASFSDTTDPDYLTSDDSDTYNVDHSTTSGLGGEATIRSDDGKGTASVLCADGDDTDGDAICDTWETTGLPYVVSGTVTRILFSEICPTCDGGTALEMDPSVGTKDLYVEIDAMLDHPPDPTSLSDVDAHLLANGVDLHTLIDRDGLTAGTSLPHVTPISIWSDLDADFTNDFNTIKAENLGPPLIHSTITKTQVNEIRTIDASIGEYQLEISGLDITTPADPRTLPTIDRTKGTIVFRVLVTLNGDGLTTFSEGPTAASRIVGDAGPYWPSAGDIKAFFTTGNPNLHKIIANVPFTTGNDLTSFDIGTVILPFKVADINKGPVGCDAGTGMGVLCTDPGTQFNTPVITTTLEDAYAQAFRYFLWAHSFGGPSGQAELRGNDAAITLGEGFNLAFNGHPGGNTIEQSGTFAHELGHLLGLQHGGPERSIEDSSFTFADSTINCKPNYASVMSYSRQIDNFLGASWAVKFSDGSHGGNPSDPLKVNSGGITETTLTSAFLLPGLIEQIVFGTPDSTMGNIFLKKTSDGSDDSSTIDWKDTGAAFTGADVSDFAISGCLASGPTSSTYYDYNDFAHMDFNFRDNPSGQFDGITIHVSDITPNQIWQSILSAGVFDGLAEPPNEEGNEIVKANSVVPVKIEILDDEGNSLGLQAGFGHVFVSMDPDSGSNGPDPRVDWVQVTDVNPANFGEELMFWDTANDVLKLSWKTPKNSGVFDGFNPGSFSIEGKWFIRAVLFDPDNPDDNPDRPLAGKPNDATSDFLTDQVLPHLPDSVKDKATMQITLTKDAPGGAPPAIEADAELDPIVAFIESEQADGRIKKGTANGLLSDMESIILLFSQSDPIACDDLDAVIATVGDLAANKMDPVTKATLLTDLGTAESTKGC